VLAWGYLHYRLILAASATPINDAIDDGLSDSCYGCLGRPRDSANSGGDVATTPNSRDAPHLFGLFA
jgi:hypothetical protein